MNPRLIRVVTSQFAQLQGLHTAAYGLALLLLAFVTTLPNQDPIDGIVRTMVWLVPMTFLIWANHAIPSFYARRFGRVVQKGLWDRPDWRFMLWLLMAVVLLAAHTSSTILWIAWAGYPLFVVFSAWPYRLQHLVIAAAATYAVSRHLTAARSLTDGEVRFDVYLIAITLVVAGMLDHFVLVRALPSSATRLESAGSGEEDPTYDRDVT